MDSKFELCNLGLDDDQLAVLVTRSAELFQVNQAKANDVVKRARRPSGLFTA